MDFSKFSNDEFDPKTWINEAFASVGADTDREQFAQSLVMKLQLFVQEVNSSLEQTCQQIVQAMPKVVRGVDGMGQEAALLRNQMKTVQQDVAKVEHETAEAMDALLKIDLVKERMQHVEKSLREVDNWTGLTRDIDDVFASGDVDLMAERLVALQRCLELLGEKMPDYEQRRAFVERLKDQFVAAISPSVVGAFTSQRAESVHYFFSMFDKLHRLPDLQGYYRKYLKGELTTQWQNVLDAEDVETAAEVLSRLHDVLLSTWFTQLAWGGVAFRSSPQLVCGALSSALEQLEPPVAVQLAARLDGASHKLPVFISLRKSCDNTWRSLSQSLAGAGLGSTAEAAQFSGAVYEPLLHFARQYQQYQQSELLACLNACSFEGASFSLTMDGFDKSVDVIFTAIDEAVEQCNKFLGVVGLPSLVKALQPLFNNYFAMAKKVFRMISKIDSNAASSDWDRVNAALRLVTVCGRLISQIDSLNASVAQSIAAAQFDQMNLDESPQLDCFSRLLLHETQFRSAVDDVLLRLIAGEGGTGAVLADTEKQATKMCGRAIRLTSESVLAQFDHMFAQLPKLDAWAAETVGESLATALPAFARSPNEYVTQIGQLLMTFAHQLEPYLAASDEHLCGALVRAAPSQLRKHLAAETRSAEDAVGFWLRSTGDALMTRFADAALRIRQLSAAGAQQLAADIEYFCNVLEDLAMTPSDDLTRLKALLLMDKSQLRDAADYPAPLLSAVREMRRLS